MPEFRQVTEDIRAAMGKMPTPPQDPILARLLAKSSPGLPARAANPLPAGQVVPSAPSKKGPPKLKSREEILRTLQKGIDLQRKGDLPAAEFHYQHVLRDHPANADALNLMGVLAADGQMYHVAADFLEKAVRQAPNNPVILNNLANAYIMLDAEKKAIPLLEKALKHSKDHFEMFMNLARAKNKLGQASAALALFETAIEKNPMDAGVRASYGSALINAGKLEDGIRVLRALIADQPAFPQAHYELASARKFAPEEMSEVEAIEGLLATNEKYSKDERALLHHAAGKIHNDARRFAPAFDHFKAAKAESATGFELAAFERQVDATMALYDRVFFERFRGFGSDSEKPVFIVGMPRSGTTLTEQILASHPSVHGAGELVDIELLSRKVEPLLRAARGGAAAPSRSAIGDFAKIYLTEIESGGGDALRITDKMPHNFQYLGLIHLLFPKAKIIHCLRDPMDNCVSCFMNPFNKRHGYNADLATLGGYYQAYRRLMDHWTDVLPAEIFTMQYEDTVGNQNAVSRALIDHVGLPWDDACLSFHENGRDVMTLSRWQVRQPIYTSSVKRWKHFDAYLDDLKFGLGTYFYP